MRQFLFCILCGCLFVSCHDDESNNPANNLGKDTTEVVTPINIEDHIKGEWIADYAIDDPKGYRWEILKFQESGMMYFSNYSEQNTTSHDYVNGTYIIEGNVIKTNCQLGWSDLYKTYNAELHVKLINEFTLKADIVVSGQVIENNTYIKVIDKVELKKGDYLPDYAKLLNGETAKDFKSHNDFIASVDKATGLISSQWSGSTYIDVITSMGTAAVQVTVNSILYFDYEDYVGATMTDIVRVFNRQNTTNTNVLEYKYNENYYPSLQQKSGNWNSMHIRLNSQSGYVDNITLIAKDDVWFTDYQISDYLSEKYTLYQRTSKYDPETGITQSEFEKTKNYYIGRSLKEAKVGVIWNNESKALSFVDLKDEHRNTVDYGHFMCMTPEDIKTIMGEPRHQMSDDTEKWMAYIIGGRYTNIIKFSFKNRNSNKIKKTVQEIDVFLYDDIDINDAVSILDGKYDFSDEVADTRIYYSATPKMMVDIWLGNTTTTKLIQYLYQGIDIEDDGMWPEYAAIVLNNVNDVKGAMGEPDESANDTFVFHTYQFMGVFWCYDIKGNDYMKKVALNNNLRWSNATNIIVYLKDDINPSDITTYLGSLYKYQEGSSVPSEGIFIYKTTIRYIDVWIEYNSTNGMIYYYRK